MSVCQQFVLFQFYFMVHLAADIKSYMRTYFMNMTAPKPITILLKMCIYPHIITIIANISAMADEYCTLYTIFLCEWVRTKKIEYFIQISIILHIRLHRNKIIHIFKVFFAY